MEYDTPKRTFTAKVESNGRIVIPAAVRETLGLVAGDEVTLLVEGDDLIVRSRRAAVRRVRERLAAARPPEVTGGGGEVDAFLAERTAYWESTLAEEGGAVRLDLPALLEKLRRAT